MTSINRGRTASVSRAAVLALATSALVALPAGAQPRRPDFSGRWMNPVQTDDSGRPHGASGSRGSGWGREFTVADDDGVLTVTRFFFTRGDLQPPITLRVALDGSPTVDTILMGRGIERHTSTAAWDGDTLVITTRYEVPAGAGGALVPYEEVRTLSLQPPPEGRNAWPPSLTMVIVRKGVMGGPPSTTRLVFSRDY